MKNKRKSSNRILYLKVLASVFLFSLTWYSQPAIVYGTSASEESTTTDALTVAGFTYQILFPDNQVNNELGYYHLRLNAGKQQTISIILSNPSSEDITIEFAVNGAKTNRSGVIEYANREIANDASLVAAFEDLVSEPAPLSLAAGETKQVDFAIQMPEASYEGVIAGGLQMMKSGQTENLDANHNSTVINQYAYVIPVVLQESDEELTPELELNRVYADQLDSQNTISINFSNIIAAYLNDLSVEVQIMKQGSSKVLYEDSKNAMRMAPNSFMDFPVGMNGDEMEAGQYTAHILAEAGQQRWEWTEDFEITAEEAANHNERDVGLNHKTGINWQLIILILVVIVVAAVGILSRATKKCWFWAIENVGNWSPKLFRSFVFRLAIAFHSI